VVGLYDAPGDHTLTPFGKSGLSSANTLRAGYRSRICLVKNRISFLALGGCTVRIWLTVGTRPMLRGQVVFVVCLLGECFWGARWSSVACRLFSHSVTKERRRMDCARGCGRPRCELRWRPQHSTRCELPETASWKAREGWIAPSRQPSQL
jgi:hypothetical protein